MDEAIGWAVQHVLRSRVRRGVLVGDGLRTPVHLRRFLHRIVPHAALELRGVRALAESIPDQSLRAAALSSIEHKAYHVAGGCIFATFLAHRSARAFVELVAPLECIYDYLDTLCDRHDGVKPAAYAVLHQAVADALDPAAPTHDYYALGPAGDDNGYLLRLVTRVRRSLRRIDGYEALLPPFREAAELYGEMQTIKHGPSAQREDACIAWYQSHRNARFEALEWQEFACAAGSQLQVYAPLFELLAGRPAAIVPVYDAYFPAVAALHVLLDSFIDRAEDREHDELNFAGAYASAERLRERFAWLVARARERFAGLPDLPVHAFVLRVMVLFYLTHPKVYAQALEDQAESLLATL